MLILPTAYLGNIQYYTKLLQTAEPVVIDGGEHYRKQSFRSRCEILGANGVIALTVPVYKTSGAKTPSREVRIDHSKAWRHQHWNSIHSAYKNSPYFDYYAETFEPIYQKHYDLLWELNRDLQQVVLDILEIKGNFSYSELYIEAGNEDQDWRNALSDKPRLKLPDPTFTPAPYYQVFSERTEFAPNLSILDLIFCEGPSSLEIIRKSTI